MMNRQAYRIKVNKLTKPCASPLQQLLTIHRSSLFKSKLFYL